MLLSALSNTEGRLHLDKKDSFIDTLLNWIINGAGSWAINGKRGAKQKKEKITSKRSATIKTEDLDVELENYSADEVKDILQKVMPKVTAMRKPKPLSESKKTKDKKTEIEKMPKTKKQ